MLLLDGLAAASNSCDARYLKELLSGLLDACDALLEPAA
jgi:hypothetical protein